MPKLEEAHAVYNKYAQAAITDLIDSHIRNVEKVNYLITDIDVALHGGTYSKSEIIKFKMLFLKMMKESLMAEKGQVQEIT